MEDHQPAASAILASAPSAPPMPGVSVFDSDAPAHTLAVQVVPAVAPDETFKHLAEITGAAAWPFVALIAVLVTHKQLRDVVHSLAQRIKDPRTTIEAGPFKIGEQLRDLKLGAEETNTRVQVLTQLESAKAAANPEVAKPIPEELRALAERYEKVSDPALEKRIQQKDDLAAKMASLVIREQLSRKSLAEAATSDGLRTALATVVHTVPLPGDDVWLAQSGPDAEFKHTRYRFMMAIARLARLGMLSPARAREFLTLAESYKKGADRLLLERIARTEELLHTSAD
jgi:hypothetical protein